LSSFITGNVFYTVASDNQTDAVNAYH